MTTSEFQPLNEAEIQALKLAKENDIGILAVDYTPADLRVSYEWAPGGLCVCIIVVRDQQGNHAPILFRGCGQGEVFAFDTALRNSNPVTLWPMSMWDEKSTADGRVRCRPHHRYPDASTSNHTHTSG